MTTEIIIEPFSPSDRSGWELLSRGYKDFYKSPASDQKFDNVWKRLLRQDVIFGLGAKVDGTLVGIAHYLFHSSVWAPSYCYLQDLFTAPEARGRGVARTLIEAVANQARANGANRLYWAYARAQR